MLALGRDIGESVYVFEADRPSLKITLKSYSIVNQFATAFWTYSKIDRNPIYLTPKTFSSVPTQGLPMVELSVFFRQNLRIPTRIILDLPGQHIQVYREEYLKRLNQSLLETLKKDSSRPINSREISFLKNKALELRSSGRE